MGISRRDLLKKAGQGMLVFGGVSIVGTEKALGSLIRGRRGVQVGGVFSLTGQFERVGAIQQAAWQAWVQQVNGTGGLCQRPVELVVEDDQSSQEGAIAAYERLASRKGVERVELVTRPWIPGREDIERRISELGIPMLSFVSGESVDELRIIARVIGPLVNISFPQGPFALEGAPLAGSDCEDYQCGNTFQCTGGIFDDFECTQRFICLNNFNCVYSFDSEDCENLFECRFEYKAEGHD